jgi:hypothetical protein
METGNVNISSVSFNFNDLIELVKRLSDKEKKQLNAFLKKDAKDEINNDYEGFYIVNKELGLSVFSGSPGEKKAKSKLNVSDFSFLETQEMLKNIKTSFSEEVVAERREAL